MTDHSAPDTGEKRPALIPTTPAGIAQAGELLRAGRLVAFPTETVYGLGADATDDRAVAAIFAAKGRPQFNPLIAHVPDLASAQSWGLFDDRAHDLATQFWPGPLTMVVPRPANSALSLLVSAGLDSIAIRVPGHPVAQAILRTAGKPIAAPSANRSGAVSPTTPHHVLESLGDRVDAIVTGGKCMVGLESTVIDLTGPEAVLLRPGAVLPDEMERLIGPVRLSAGDPTAPKSPGQLESHYAPNAAVRLNASSAEEDEAFLTFGPDRFVFGGTTRLNLSLEGDLNEAAANLFSHLRSLDQSGTRRIAVMPIPEVGLGLAINDRLRRAAAPRS
ncbi:L-threonylcarbamoyladenylate synthase [Azospirillum lipoferum]|uniref:Threonylcarbamoyl-AMP synthase n=1 Tax=Azospirillum lipoferum TaxID=193 RepID=A0A5A9GW93_AZOLI|nr:MULTISPECIES: L-threonylcarbamoyladenylate synthase [Azospirillum]KAA0598072.1 threonylcarbamoyl-AMP synthase [Azospirillum lipoferum]MCP1613816.1 L-threonylcarbamoyladenylate synthase [Azospirillum lipoferum]MDW5534732.1 L-threonylcarbamoyladenylate synthase [Azospirillum sp. NL1]